MSQPFNAFGDTDAQTLMMTLNRIARNACELLDIPSVSLALLDGQSGELVIWASHGDTAGASRPRRFRPHEGIEGWVAAHLEPLEIEDTSADPRAAGLSKVGLRSLVCVPLIDGRQLLGAMTAAAAIPGAFDARRKHMLEILSDQATLAISRTIQAETTKAQARELQALLDVASALTSTLEPDQVFEHVVEGIRAVIGCEDAIIYSYDEGANALQMVTGLGARLDRLGGARIPLRDSRSIAAWVANNRRPRLFAPGTGAVGTVTEVFLGGDKLSLMCAPLISKDRLQGVIMFGRPEPFHPADLNTVVNLSNIIAATLENVSLYQNARAERERQAAVYASASDAIAIVDEQQALIEVNDAFAALVGKPQAELLGRPSYEMLAGRAASSCLLCDPDGPLARALEDGSSIPHLECAFDAPESRGALEGRMHKQRLRHIDFSVTPIAGPQGRRALLVGRDVTAAREVDQMKSGFLSMVSHELRGPLQVVNGYLDLLLDGTAGAMTGEQEGFVQRSRSGSEQLTALVDDLLLISRRDAGQFTLNRRPVDLSQTIRDMVDEMEIVAADAQVRLTLQAPPALPLISADSQRIGQVTRNLISNAIKFTPAGGSVTVSVAATNREIVLQVADTGVGIPLEDQAKIFDRFYQTGAEAQHGQAAGQGLGLAIVRIIVEGHDGTVAVESAPGQGSVFTVRLPVA
jgi:signal transduction histidine kinase/GAF domain-containing protein